MRGDTSSTGGVKNIEIARIRPNPAQPRQIFDEDAMAELAASIAERGVLQPIIVRQINDGYELVAGERRWRAAQRAQLHDIPALIREFDESRAEVADRKRPAGEFERDRRGGSLSPADQRLWP